MREPKPGRNLLAGQIVSACQSEGIARAKIEVVTIERWLEQFASLVARDVEILTEMDAAIGDADHGVNMQRGMYAVASRIGRQPLGTTYERLCADVGATLVSAAGGAGGLLYGTFFMSLGAAAGSEAAVAPDHFASALRAGLASVVARGGCQIGDKTMVDALTPAVTAFVDEARSTTLGAAPAAALEAARRGFDRAVPLVARRGRASYLGIRSAGHPDPGAASTVLLFEALRNVLTE